MVKESTFLKGNFCSYKGFMDVFYIFTSAWRKPQNVHLKFIFCLVLSRFHLRERIHDPVSVTRIAFLGLTNGFLNKNFQVIKLFINDCSFITFAQNTIVRLLPFLELKLKVLFLYMFHWINIHFLIHYLPIKNFASLRKHPFLLTLRRRDIPIDEEQGETDVFAR